MALVDTIKKGIYHMVETDLKRQLKILVTAGLDENAEQITKLFRIYLKYNIDACKTFKSVAECARFAVATISVCDNEKEQRQKITEYLGAYFYGKCWVSKKDDKKITMDCGKTLRTGIKRFTGNTEQCDIFPDATTCNNNNKCEWNNGKCEQKTIYPLFSRLPPV